MRNAVAVIRDADSVKTSRVICVELLSGKGVGVIEPSTVMLWGGQTETEEVLKAVFEPRGYTVRRWSSKSFADKPLNDRDAAITLREHQPQLLVVDQDDDSVPPCEHWAEIPRIIIGKYAPSRKSTAENGRCKTFAHPFDYGELVRAIESML